MSRRCNFITLDYSIYIARYVLRLSAPRHTLELRFPPTPNIDISNTLLRASHKTVLGYDVLASVHAMYGVMDKDKM